MKESVLKSLMRLFAIVSQVHSVEELVLARGVVASYVGLIVRSDKVKQYLIMYDFYHNNLRERENKTGDKQLSLFSVKAMIICENANKYLSQKQKIFVYTHILEVLAATGHSNIKDIDFVKSIATALKLDEAVFNQCFAFVFNKFEKIEEKRQVLFVGARKPRNGFMHIYKEFLAGELVFLNIERINICLFKLIGQDDQLYFNERKITLNTTYIFEKGAFIKSPLLGTIYYNDIIKRFLQSTSFKGIDFTAQNVSYAFNKEDIGIHPFSLQEDSGQLIGVMGGSGVGKSTLINLLNGNLKPSQGRVLLNGFDVHADKKSLQGFIGYVPQEDLLIEELTVFENLYFSARLCFKEDTRQMTLKKVYNLLYSLDLYTTRDLKVGSPLNKFISGGQRKRLNIALELIREPHVLFVDEPTSGLSSTDSDKVIELLKHQALTGKLVIVNIHQPSSDIFKQFDKLILLDIGGRMVFNGKPQDSLVYLKKFNQLVNAEEGECPSCGNLNPEQILQILEAKRVDDYGEFTNERQVDSEVWYRNYLKKNTDELKSNSKKKNLPKTSFSLPGNLKQFLIFNQRNILTKLSDKQFVFINMLEAPVLAFILSWFTKYKAGSAENPVAYNFFENINVPVYIFMSVIVAVFLGLMLSAEDIIRDRKILKREAFLNLNRINYYNAKIFLLAVVLALQTFLFVLIGNSFLQINGMLLSFWLILWLVSMVGGIVGLNISASLKSVVSIYILIPILLVPQILLGGAMIRFDKLNSRLSKVEYVPLVGDVIPSRWAYESLMVYQFFNNDYQKLIIEQELMESTASYGLNYYIPALRSIIDEIKESSLMQNKGQDFNNKIAIVNREFELLKKTMPGCFDGVGEINANKYSISTHLNIEKAVDCARSVYIRNLSIAIREKDNRLSELENDLGGREELLKLRNENSNQKLNEVVLNKTESEKVRTTKSRIVRMAEPIYNYPDNPLGRAQLFAPSKQLAKHYIDTYWFNAIVLLLMISVFYILLIFEIFPKLIAQSKRIRIKSFIHYIIIGLRKLKEPLLKR